MPRRSIEDWALLALGMVALIATVMGTLAVVSRYLFALPISFSDEVVTYLVVWSLLIAIGVGERDDVHIRATVVTDRLGPRSRRWLARASRLLTVGFAAVMVWYGGIVAWHRYTLNEVSPTILQFPQWLARIAVPVGFVLVAYAAWRRLRRPMDAPADPT